MNKKKLFVTIALLLLIKFSYAKENVIWEYTFDDGITECKSLPQGATIDSGRRGKSLFLEKTGKCFIAEKDNGAGLLDFWVNTKEWRIPGTSFQVLSYLSQNRKIGFCIIKSDTGSLILTDNNNNTLFMPIYDWRLSGTILNKNEGKKKPGI